MSTSASLNASASVTAAQCAASITVAVCRSAIAHNEDTDFTGEKVRSYPATGVAGGRDIRLITEEIPQGDDFVFDAEIPRCVTAYLELEGYTPGGAFYKLLGEIDADTVVFFPPHSEKTLQYFAAAEKLGRCIVLALDRSPLSGLSAGSARMCAELAYMLRKADLVISPSAADCRMADSLGVAPCVRIRYFFPYSDSEISPAPLEGRHIAYFVASAAANLERPVAAFMKVRQKYPDATLYVAAGLEMKAGKRLTDFFTALNALPESEGIRAEMKLLKPLRATFQPPPEQWPTTEAYFDLYLYPEVNEFTVNSTMGPNAYVWGYLAARP